MAVSVNCHLPSARNCRRNPIQDPQNIESIQSMKWIDSNDQVNRFKWSSESIQMIKRIRHCYRIVSFVMNSVSTLQKNQNRLTYTDTSWTSRNLTLDDITARRPRDYGSCFLTIISCSLRLANSRLPLKMTVRFLSSIRTRGYLSISHRFNIGLSFSMAYRETRYKFEQPRSQYRN